MPNRIYPIVRLYPAFLVALASLLIAGASLAAPAAPEGAAVQQAATAPPVIAQPPQPDGSIIHEVKPGDTLFSIANAYKVDVDTLRKLNGLTPEVPTLKVGQRLLIKPAPPPPTLPPNATVIVVTATFTPGGQQPVPPPEGTAGPTVTGPTAAGTAAPTGAPATGATPAATQPATAAPTTAPTAAQPIPTLTPAATEIPPTLPPTVVPISSKPILCVSVYDDTNTNHYRDSDEKLLAGIDITITPKGGAPLKVASRADDAFCFSDMAAGLASVSTTPPADYGLTSPAALEVELTAGAQVSVAFGVAKGYQAAPITPPAPTVPPPTPALQTGSMVNTVFNYSGIIVLVLAGIVLVGGVIVALLARR